MKLKEISNVVNVAAGQTVIAQLPVGPTYDEILIEFGGTTFDETYMENIRLMANGKEIQRYATGEELKAIND